MFFCLFFFVFFFNSFLFDLCFETFYQNVTSDWLPFGVEQGRGNYEIRLRNDQYYCTCPSWRSLFLSFSLSLSLSPSLFLPLTFSLLPGSKTKPSINALANISLNSWELTMIIGEEMQALMPPPTHPPTPPPLPPLLLRGRGREWRKKLLLSYFWRRSGMRERMCLAGIGVRSWMGWGRFGMGNILLADWVCVGVDAWIWVGGEMNVGVGVGVGVGVSVGVSV